MNRTRHLDNSSLSNWAISSSKNYEQSLSTIVLTTVETKNCFVKTKPNVGEASVLHIIENTKQSQSGLSSLVSGLIIEQTNPNRSNQNPGFCAENKEIVHKSKNMNLQNEPKIEHSEIRHGLTDLSLPKGEASLLRYHSPQSEGLSLF